jgi:SAM-dependent methyltransferase
MANILLEYLHPPCRPWTLDVFGNRRLIVHAVREVLPDFIGSVLDVGCGEKPYQHLLTNAPGRATSYLGLDLPGNNYGEPDLVWDGVTIPLPQNKIDSVMLTEVLEHTPAPQTVLNEVARVLKPNGFLFLTVPFIWPIHCVPHDEFRYTPFALRRLLETAGFKDIKIKATGGRHAVLAVVLGLWVRRRPLTSRVHLVTRCLLSYALWPVVWVLFKLDRIPNNLEESTLFVGLSATARKSL